MTVLDSSLDTSSLEYTANAEAMAALVADLRDKVAVIATGAVAMLTWPLLGIRSPHRRDPLAEDEPPYPV